MKKFLVLAVMMLPLCLFGGGDQLVLKDGKSCNLTGDLAHNSLTVDDLARIDFLEKQHREKAASKKREVTVDDHDEQEVEKKARPISTEVLFTCKGATPIQDRLIELIKQENLGISGAQYVFTNRVIAKTIVDQIAKEGIKAKILVDRSYKEMHSTSCLIQLIKNGVEVRVPLKTNFKKLMHNKFFIFEDNNGKQYLALGSYNISFQANNNDEFEVLTDNPELIVQFEQQLEVLMESSHLLKQKVSPDGVPLDSLQSCPTQHTQSFS